MKLSVSNSTPLQSSFSLSLSPPSLSLFLPPTRCISRPCSLSLPCNWQAAVMEVNSTAAILIPSTPTLCQLELLAASDDGAIKRDVLGLFDRWIHASSVLIKPARSSAHSWHTCHLHLQNAAARWEEITPEYCKYCTHVDEDACCMSGYKSVRYKKKGW